MPLNYAKWDNLDVSDSDNENRKAVTSITQPKVITPPTNESTRDGGVQAVRIFCEIDKRNGHPIFGTHFIPDDDPVFETHPLPVSARIRLPLVMRKVGTPYSPGTGDLDCQIATYLAIDTKSGFAPYQWQSDVGTVIVARQDKKPLTPQQLECFWMYNSEILDKFGDEISSSELATYWYNRPAFEEWFDNYVAERHENSLTYATVLGNPGPAGLDDFSNVVSPYDV